MKVLAFSLFLFGSFSFPKPVIAQELNGRVSISTPGLPESDRLIMQSLQSQITEFINQRIWTSYQFNPQEKIELSLFFSITERVGDEFRGSLQVQSRRPVFNTSYHSPVFNHMDRDVVFRFEENQTLEFAEGTFTSNLTSLLAYYVYIIIGLDFDTFAPLGGSEFFQRAQNIVSQAQNTPEPGWRASENQRNRYWLAENLLNQAFRPMRIALYNYHRLGFDVMVQNISQGRLEVINALELIAQANMERPGSFLLQTILNAKRDELLELFRKANPSELTRAIAVLTRLDPANRGTYEDLRQ